MGCTATKLEGCVGGMTNGGSYNCFHPNKPVLKTEEDLEKHKEEFHEQYQNAINRVSAYQKGKDPFALSNKSQYSFLLLFYRVLRVPERPVSVSEIAIARIS